MNEILHIINVYVQYSPDILSNVKETLSLQSCLNPPSLVCVMYVTETHADYRHYVSLSSPAPAQFFSRLLAQTQTFTVNKTQGPILLQPFQTLFSLRSCERVLVVLTGSLNCAVCLCASWLLVTVDVLFLSGLQTAATHVIWSVRGLFSWTATNQTSGQRTCLLPLHRGAAPKTLRRW